MMPLNDALSITLGTDILMSVEQVNLAASLNRVLAEDVYSSIELPPFDKSAMDGFAFNCEDDSSRFEIVEFIAAGVMSNCELKKGKCAKIMTGAAIPKGANCVVRVEDTSVENGYMHILKREQNKNVCRKGENISIGDKVVSKSTLIKPKVIGTLASVGLDKILVYKKPIVGIIVTGSELKKQGEALSKCEIYDSNGPQIYSQILEISAIPKQYGVVRDDVKLINEIFKKAILECDIIVFSGGMSVGDLDFVPEILRENNVQIMFEKIAIKPGKPTLFGVKDGKIIFGLPGNPVASFVIFELFLKPLIYKMIGYGYKPDIRSGVLQHDLRKKSNKIIEFIPVIYEADKVAVAQYLGSAHINILPKINGFISLGLTDTEIKSGSIVSVTMV